jgi:hypothetical protein
MLLATPSRAAKAILKLCIKGEDPYEYNHTAEIELGGVRRRGNRCSLLACGN